MKKKVLVILIMLITILIVGGSNVYAICVPCAAGSHAGCTNLVISGTVIRCGCCSQNVGTHTHSFGSWSSNGLNVSHSRSCSVCGYSVTESHSYGGWNYSNDSQHRKDCSKCNSYRVG